MAIGLVKKENNAEGRKRPSADSEIENVDRTKQDTEDEDLYDENIPEDYNDVGAGRNASSLIKVALAVVIAIVLIAVLVFLFMNRRPKETEQDPDFEVVQDDGIADNESSTGEGSSTVEGAVYDENGNMIYNEDGEIVGKDAINPGITEYDSENSETTATVYSASDFIKDLNGIDVSAVYNVISRDYIYDYVNYTAKRAIIDQGMEMYWLDVVYNDRNYRMQIPFYRFKNMKESGICKVQLELLTLEGGGKIISYMQVVDDSAGVD